MASSAPDAELDQQHQQEQLDGPARGLAPPLSHRMAVNRRLPHERARAVCAPAPAFTMPLRARTGCAILVARVRGRATVFFDDLVVMARGEAPDPIPNSAVKTLSADGTAS